MRRRLVEFARRTDWDATANTAFAAGPGTDDLDGATVLVVRRSGPRTLSHLPELLPTADVVVLLLPLGTGTARLVDTAFLSRMRRGALLVNAARGGLVDTTAL